MATLMRHLRAVWTLAASPGGSPIPLLGLLWGLAVGWSRLNPLGWTVVPGHWAILALGAAIGPTAHAWWYWPGLDASPHTAGAARTPGPVVNDMPTQSLPRCWL